MKNKALKYTVVILILVLLLGILLKFALTDDSTGNNNTSNSESGSSTTKEVTKTSTSIDQEDKRGETSYSNYTAQINLSDLSYTRGGFNISGSTITITTAGTYYFTGTLTDGNIVINAGDSDNVVLVFDNANITSTTTAVINGINAKNIYINLKEGSTNTFTDASKYTVFTSDDEPNATVFSKTDLLLCGTGTLTVNANYEDAIVSKDDLIITDVTLNITSADDGIRGKDSADIKNANITIYAGGDGIKSTNDTDTARGYVIIDGGTINIEAKDDGIQAETVLTIANADITVKGAGKGLKAETEITINSGNTHVTSTDDSIHSNDHIIINGRTMSISTGDDGIHADSSIIINGGTINITKSHEGIEANYIEINNGDIKVVADDDGINAISSNSSSNGGMMNMNGNGQLIINGGTIYVDSQGDGLDANGTITQTSGNVVVAGTTSGGNAALDYDNTFNISGGSLIAYGATSMWQNTSATSSQYTICFSVTGKARDSIELKDANGSTIESFTTDKAYGAILISNSKLTKGTTYILYVNGSQISSQELTSIVTSNVSGQGMMGGGGMMNGGGRQGR